MYLNNNDDDDGDDNDVLIAKNIWQSKYTRRRTFKYTRTQEHTDTNMQKQTKLTHSLRVLGVAKCGKSRVEASIWMFPK